MTDSNNIPPTDEVDGEKIKYFKIQRYVGITVSLFIITFLAFIGFRAQKDNQIPDYQFTIAPENSPNLQLEMASEIETFNLNEFRGQAIIIAFWAYWCEPCLEDLPLLLQNLKDIDNLKIITLNFDEKPSQIRKARELIDQFEPSEQQIHFFNQDMNKGPSLNDFREKMGATAYPYHIAADTNHKIRYLGFGKVSWDSPQVQKQMRELPIQAVHKYGLNHRFAVASVETADPPYCLRYPLISHRLDLSLPFPTQRNPLHLRFQNSSKALLRLGKS
ncbi:MAG: TlpA family protein disulfide reductase [Bdellovibrionales bacterium]